MTIPAPKVKLYLSEILRPEFSCQLQQESRKYNLIQKAKSKKEWHFGNLVNVEWESAGDDMKTEISKDQFYAECSRVMNAELPFPIVTDSGQTLRRWCNVAESYANMPGLEAFQEALSFDHFFHARRMANDPAIPLSIPVLVLAEAVKNKWVVKEMIQHYAPPELVHDYDKALGWLDSLQAIKLDWIKNKTEREEAQMHLSAYRQIVERNK